jgi:hypothetical protein
MNKRGRWVSKKKHMQGLVQGKKNLRKTEYTGNIAHWRSIKARRAGAVAVINNATDSYDLEPRYGGTTEEPRAAGFQNVYNTNNPYYYGVDPHLPPQQHYPARNIDPYSLYQF